MIMSAMKLPSPSSFIDKEKNATDEDASPGIQGPMNKAQEFLVVKCKHRKNHVPDFTSNRTPGDVTERIRVAVAKKTWAIPLSDPAVRGPPMESSLTET